VDAEQNEEFPKYFTDVAITVTAEGSIDGKHIKRAVELSHEKYCSAINSLKANSRVKVIYNGEEL
ncbi:MAG TPA: OsmC family peroxiredoxin, partial [Candidatus Nosocomiicoccus stercorigallinarum]|nr:OsmC family peroxiredoxin [Candidatus Nosocomiicoccus stercorigallinarum]